MNNFVLNVQSFRTKKKKMQIENQQQMSALKQQVETFFN